MTVRPDTLFDHRKDWPPRLSREEEQELARRNTGGDVEAAHTLILSHLPFVHHIARRYGRDGLPLGDLLQEGTIGLMEAVRRFNPDRGVRLSTYAMWWIRASMQDYVVRSRSLVKIGTTAAQKAMFFNLRRRFTGLPDLETLSDDLARAVAERFNTSVDEVRRFAQRIARPDQSLDVPLSTDADTTWTDLVPDPDPSPEDRVSLLRESRAILGALAKGLSNLPPRERLIIRSRFFADPALSRAALGEQLGVSKERVRQLELRALNRLKEFIAAVGEAWEPTPLALR